MKVECIRVTLMAKRRGRRRKLHEPLSLPRSLSFIRCHTLCDAIPELYELWPGSCDGMDERRADGSWQIGRLSPISHGRRSHGKWGRALVVWIAENVMNEGEGV
ncbi:unnamed protein product [Durusdinium trenchii]|uniref:Uncharacterized protein n=1 Tax=Durusdinium trenchii TaxID=1381693 RepID=A0ABP0KVJ7_9DINO